MALTFVRPRHYRDGLKFRLQVRRAFIRFTLWHQVYVLTWCASPGIGRSPERAMPPMAPAHTRLEPETSLN